MSYIHDIQVRTILIIEDCYTVIQEALSNRSTTIPPLGYRIARRFVKKLTMAIQRAYISMKLVHTGWANRSILHGE